MQEGARVLTEDKAARDSALPREALLNWCRLMLEMRGGMFLRRIAARDPEVLLEAAMTAWDPRDTAYACKSLPEIGFRTMHDALLGACANPDALADLASCPEADVPKIRERILKLVLGQKGDLRDWGAVVNVARRPSGYVDEMAEIIGREAPVRHVIGLVFAVPGGALDLTALFRAMYESGKHRGIREVLDCPGLAGRREELSRHAALASTSAKSVDAIKDVARSARGCLGDFLPAVARFGRPGVESFVQAIGGPGLDPFHGWLAAHEVLTS